MGMQVLCTYIGNTEYEKYRYVESADGGYPVLTQRAAVHMYSRKAFVIPHSYAQHRLLYADHSLLL